MLALLLGGRSRYGGSTSSLVELFYAKLLLNAWEGNKIMPVSFKKKYEKSTTSTLQGTDE